MKRTSSAIAVGSLLLMVVSLSDAAAAQSVPEAIGMIAGRLEAEQVREGPGRGSWPGEEMFTGLMVVGMVDAYETTGDSAYLTCAELGGDYIILTNAAGNFFGDEALALACLSLVNDPNDYVWGTSDNIWGLSLKVFYSMIEASSLGTEGYISSFDGADPSLAVLFLSEYTVAAYIVEAEDKEVWRNALIDWLSVLDDQACYPVMALGAATWALAVTGPSLDQTVIDPCGLGAPYWKLKKLEDLPGILLSHQVPSGKPSAGSFYWRFDHSDAGLEGMESSGYTEDAVFATLGLLGAYGDDPNVGDPDLAAAIRTASDVLVGSVADSGEVWERLSQQGVSYYTYGAEMLRVLRRLSVVPAEPDPNAPPVSGESAMENGSLWSVSAQAPGSGRPARYNHRRVQSILNVDRNGSPSFGCDVL